MVSAHICKVRHSGLPSASLLLSLPPLPLLACALGSMGVWDTHSSLSAMGRGTICSWLSEDTSRRRKTFSAFWGGQGYRACCLRGPACGGQPLPRSDLLVCSSCLITWGLRAPPRHFAPHQRSIGGTPARKLWPRESSPACPSLMLSHETGIRKEALL